MHQTNTYFPTNLVIKQLFRFSRMRTSQNFDFLFANLFRSFSIALFFLFLSSILAVFCPLYRLFLHRIVASQIFGKGKKFDLQRVADKPAHWQWIFPQNVIFSVSVTLLGLVRISKTRCRWKLFVMFLLTNLLTYINWKLNGYRKENMHDHASFHMEW